MFRCYFSSLYTTRFLSPFSLENAQPIRSRLSLEIITIPSYGPGRFLLLVAKKKIFLRHSDVTRPLPRKKQKKTKKTSRTKGQNQDLPPKSKEEAKKLSERANRGQ